MSDNTTQLMFINPNEKVQPAVLAGLLSRNVSLVYQWAQDGRLPVTLTQYSYKECINHLITSLLRAEELKGLRIKESVKLRAERLEADPNDGMHPLMVAKLEQNIKTEMAKEAEIWQRVAIKRGEYISFIDQLDLVEGFVNSINDTLNFISNNYPETQKHVDAAKDELYQLGVTLCAEATEDANNFIDVMLKRPIQDAGI
jgi:hypothetical protein